MKFAVVIPARNEEQFIGSTLQSLVDQTLRPEVCIVVDDMSTDSTPEIIKEFEYKHTFIQHYTNHKTLINYQVGGHIVDLFYKGKKRIDEKGIEYDYIVKLDADINFPDNLFEQMALRLKEEEYGIASATPYYLEGKKKIFETSPLWHSHGQFKFYNKKCLAEIGNLKSMLGWDCADNIQAIEKGWKTIAIRDINYMMNRKIGGKSSLLKGRIKHGYGAFNLGYSRLYLILKITHDLFKPPFFIGSVYYLKGYFKAWRERKRPFLTKEQVKILRKLFWQSFFERTKNREFILYQQLKKEK